MDTLFTVPSPIAPVQRVLRISTCAANSDKWFGECPGTSLDDILPTTTEGEASKLSFSCKTMLINAFVVPARPLFVPSFLTQVSVGIEHIADIIADFDNAPEAVP